MDPNETLRKLRELIKQYNETHDAHDPHREMVDAMTDLDEWLTGRGFRPKDWDHYIAIHN